MRIRHNQGIAHLKYSPTLTQSYDSHCLHLPSASQKADLCIKLLMVEHVNRLVSFPDLQNVWSHSKIGPIPGLRHTTGMGLEMRQQPYCSEFNILVVIMYMYW